MESELSGLFSANALCVVVAGTLLATLARCGISDVKVALRKLVRIGSQEFDAGANRMALAPSISEILRRGPLCTDIPLPPDPSLAKTLKAYARSGSMEKLIAGYDRERAARELATLQAARTFEYAGELAPVFGLVGTLFAITQLAPFTGDGPVDTAMASIATAVLSSLYGVLLAHMVCIPIARAIERKGTREEAERGELMDWLEAGLRGLRQSGAGKASAARRQAAA